jgi:hypothetical protein
LPTVLRAYGFRIVIRHPPREHGPAHVHVFKGNGELVIEVEHDISVRESYGMTLRDAREARALVQDHLEELRRAWKSIHES